MLNEIEEFKLYTEKLFTSAVVNVICLFSDDSALR